MSAVVGSRAEGRFGACLMASLTCAEVFRHAGARCDPDHYQVPDRIDDQMTMMA